MRLRRRRPSTTTGSESKHVDRWLKSIESRLRILHRGLRDGRIERLSDSQMSVYVSEALSLASEVTSVSERLEAMIETATEVSEMFAHESRRREQGE